MVGGLGLKCRDDDLALLSRNSEINCAIPVHLRPHPLIYKQ